MTGNDQAKGREWELVASEECERREGWKGEKERKKTVINGKRP